MWYTESAMMLTFIFDSSLCLSHLSISLSLLVRSRNSKRSLFQLRLQYDKELLSHLWQPLRVTAETSESSHKLHSHGNRKLPTMPGNCQKHLQLHSLQLQTMLFQWGLPATFAGAIWGTVTVFICQHISIRHCKLFGGLHKQHTSITQHTDLWVVIFNSHSSLNNFCFGRDFSL